MTPILFRPGRRLQSTTGGSQGQDGQKQAQNSAPTPSLGRIFSAALRSTFQSIRNVSRPQSLREAYRKNPEEMVLALILYVILRLGRTPCHSACRLLCRSLSDSETD